MTRVTLGTSDDGLPCICRFGGVKDKKARDGRHWLSKQNRVTPISHPYSHACWAMGSSIFIEYRTCSWALVDTSRSISPPHSVHLDGVVSAGSIVHRRLCHSTRSLGQM